MDDSFEDPLESDRAATEVVRQLEACLAQSNQNITQLKDSLKLVLHREENLQAEYYSLESRFGFQSMLRKGKETHLVYWYTQRIATLEAQLAQASEVQDQLSNEASKGRQNQRRIEQLQEELDKLIVYNKLLENQTLELQGTVNQQNLTSHGLTREKSFLTERVEKLTEELRQTQIEVENYGELLEVEKRKSARLQHDLDENTAKLHEKLSKYKVALDSKKSTEHENLSIVTELKKQVQVLEKEKYSLEDQVWMLKKDNESYLKKHSLYESEIQELTKLKKQQTHEREQVAKELERIQFDLEEREKLLQESKDVTKTQVGALQAELAATQHTLSECEITLEETAARLDQRDFDYTKLTRKYEDLLRKSESWKQKLGEFDQMQAKFTELTETNHQLYSRLQSAEKELEKAGTTIHELKSTLEEVSSSHQQQLELQRKEKSALENQVIQAKKEYLCYESSSRKSFTEIQLWKAALIEIACFNTIERTTVEDQLRGLLGVAAERLRGYDHDVKERIDAILDKVKQILGSQIKDPSVHHMQELLNQLNEKYRCEMAERRRLNAILQDLRGNIRVMCRVRPLLEKEHMFLECTQIMDTCQLKVTNPSTRRDSWYEFDRVFNPLDPQEVIYFEASDIVVSVMNGFNGCIMAYGQTGSGKTHTMEGSVRNIGINYRAVREMFEIVQSRLETHSYSISISILEVYNESIRDLLRPTPRKIEIREGNRSSIIITGAEMKPMSTYDDIIAAIESGKSNRSVGCTNVNEYSSRSHCIVVLYVQGTTSDGREFTSKLNLIDLAGSERVWKSEAEGLRMQEACNINQSLSALGTVLHRLASKDKHIPYRDSKLTHLLKDSLSGDAKTLMIVTVSSSSNDVSETLSSLSFGSRVASVEKGKAKINLKRGKRVEAEGDIGAMHSPPTRIMK